MRQGNAGKEFWNRRWCLLAFIGGFGIGSWFPWALWASLAVRIGLVCLLSNTFESLT
ncbi:hypothetical protein PLANPX_2744 [Lacipirellula parvula]|uniref:Uncharacterized protein n=1 Tax=Lacipirellula parvula TaxID=2650471 RepID=A0A5K7XB10_9BACT|nr:hypothetical protein PLANPX_2744 [Lacipirellula parvula]